MTTFLHFQLLSFHICVYKQFSGFVLNQKSNYFQNVLIKNTLFHFRIYYGIKKKVGVGGNLQVQLVQPLFQHGHPAQGAQAHIQAAFETLQGRDSTASLGSLCQSSVTLTEQKCFSVFTLHFLFQLCSVPLPCPQAPLKKSLAPSFSYLSLLLSIYIDSKLKKHCQSSYFKSINNGDKTKKNSIFQFKVDVKMKVKENIKKKEQPIKFK